MGVIEYKKSRVGVVTLLMDAKNRSANIIDMEFMKSLKEANRKLRNEKKLKGVIFASAKDTFLAGGDLKLLSQVTEESVSSFYHEMESLKRDMRSIETLGIPVVAALNGAALGGGWEIALTAHYRVSLDDETIRFGSPEATLGLLPGAGGVVKQVRLLGLETALPQLLEGKQFSPQKAKKMGLVHELVATKEELLGAAKKYIDEHPVSHQPYDVKGYQIPGGTPKDSQLAPKLAVAPAMLIEKTKGLYPAQEKILAAAVEGALVDVDTALRIETRYLCECVTTQVAKNMINTFWFQMNDLKSGGSRPKGVLSQKVTKVGVLGAGLMGSGIAYVSAKAGINVILKDLTLEKAQKGKAQVEAILNKGLNRGRTTEEKMGEILTSILPTADLGSLEGVDLVIEAVFENRELKGKVTRETEAAVPSTAIFASNTSTLPITGLAEASVRPENFIGLHFFSPVDKMRLVEIIRGEKTSDETLARAFDYVLQIGKLPIVVKDSRGFFTSRVFGTFVTEGLAMLAEGQVPSSIEQAAVQAGMPIGPLAITDEVSIELLDSVRKQTQRDLAKEGKSVPSHPAHGVIDVMMRLGRLGRAKGAGFYEYPQAGKKHLWKGLTDLFAPREAQPFEDMKERFLFIQALEAVRCLEEGVLTSIRDANIGSILGIGFAPWTGGAIQYVNQYGIKEFAVRALELKDRYAERFMPPPILLEMAESGNLFRDDQ